MDSIQVEEVDHPVQQVAAVTSRPGCFESQELQTVKKDLPTVQKHYKTKLAQVCFMLP